MTKKQTRVTLMLDNDYTDCTDKEWPCEVYLPEPELKEYACEYLVDICQYARGANSRGEYLFRNDYIIPLLAMMDADFTQDQLGNIVVTVGESDTLYVGHMDTVHSDSYQPHQWVSISKERVMTVIPIQPDSILTPVETFYYKEGIKVKYNYTKIETPRPLPTCLGADDGVAIAIMLTLIQHGKPGTYLFTRGEEIGCVGIQFAIDNSTLDFSQFSRSIEVDRKGTDEIIVEQSAGICASEAFGEALSAALGMNHKNSDRGSVTDVAYLRKLIPENVNVAAGYDKQHGPNESVDLNYVDALAVAMLGADIDNLPTERDPNALPPRKVYNRYSRTNFEAGFSSTRQNNFFGMNDEDDFQVWGQGMTFTQAFALITARPRSVAQFLVDQGYEAGDIFDSNR